MKQINYYVIIVCLVLLLSGCFSKKAEETGNSNIIEHPKIDESVEKTYDFLNLMNAQQILISDPQGNSVSVRDVQATQSIVQYFTDLLSDDSPTDYMYSLVAWQNGDPYVVQMSPTGIKVNEQAYTYQNKQNGEKAIVALEEVLTKYYWEIIVDVDRIYVNADDIMKTISVDDSEISTIVGIIKNSTYHNDGRTYNPLYPNYSIELSIGGKAQLEVQLLNSQVLGAKIGEKWFLYTVSKDLWTIIERQVPIPSYDINDIFYLFRSEGLSVKSNNKNWELRSENDKYSENDEYLEGFRDAITRELLVAMPSDDPFQDEAMQLTYYVQGTEITVHVGEQGFVYQGQHYRSNDILKRIIYLLDSL